MYIFQEIPQKKSPTHLDLYLLQILPLPHLEVKAPGTFLSDSPSPSGSAQSTSSSSVRLRMQSYRESLSLSSVIISWGYRAGAGAECGVKALSRSAWPGDLSWRTAVPLTLHRLLVETVQSLQQFLGAERRGEPLVVRTADLACWFITDERLESLQPRLVGTAPGLPGGGEEVDVLQEGPTLAPVAAVAAGREVCLVEYLSWRTGPGSPRLETSPVLAPPPALLTAAPHPARHGDQEPLSPAVTALDSSTVYNNH